MHGVTGEAVRLALAEAAAGRGSLLEIIPTEADQKARNGRGIEPVSDPLSDLVEQATRLGFAVHIAEGDRGKTAVALDLIRELFGQTPSTEDTPATSATGTSDWLLENSSIPLAGLAVLRRLGESPDAKPRLFVITNVADADPSSLAVLRFVGRRIDDDPVLFVLVHTAPRFDAERNSTDPSVASSKFSSGGVQSELLTLIALESNLAVLHAVLGTQSQAVLDIAERSGVCSVAAGRIRLTDDALARELVANDAALGHPQRQRILASLSPNHQAWLRHATVAAAHGDSTVVEALMSFGAVAQRNGGGEEAARAYDRAAEITLDKETELRCRYEAAKLRYHAGDAKSAIPVARRIIEETTDNQLRAEATVMFGGAAMWEADPSKTVEEVCDIAKQFVESNPVTASVAFSSAAGMAFIASDLRVGVDHAQRAGKLAEGSGDLVASATATVTLGWNLFLRGEISAAKESSAAADSLLDFFADSEVAEVAALSQLAVMRWIMDEEFDRANQWLNRLLPMMRRIGIDLSEAALSMFLGTLRFRTGRWDEAVLYAEEFVDSETIPPVARAWAHAFASVIHAARGNTERTEQLVASVLAQPEVKGSPLIRAWATSGLGHLHLSLGRYEDAVTCFTEIRSLVDGLGLVHPNFFQWHGDALDSLIASGDRAAATELADAFERQTTECRSGWLRGVIARTRGRLAETAQAAETWFGQARETFTDVGYPFELARTELARAQWWSEFASMADSVPGSTAASIDSSQATVVANSAAQEAHRIFMRLGADGWANAAQLPALEVRPDASPPTQPRLVDVLSAAEYRVVLAVADGKTSEQAANDLFLSVRTISFHLSSAYRKLGLSSRSELIALVHRAQQGIEL